MNYSSHTIWAVEMLDGHIKLRSGGSVCGGGDVMGVLCWLVGLWSSILCRTCGLRKSRYVCRH